MNVLNGKIIMPSRMTVYVRFLAGTDIKEAIIEAKQKCREWNVAYICFSFNGVNLSISGVCNIDIAVREFNKVISENDTHKYVVE